jgi:predicted P-loop ATPase
MSARVGRLWLVAAVRRIREPGCKFDEMLVLESPTQGLDKSSALAALAVKDDWFTDQLPLNADDKKVIETLAGRWIVEAAELKAFLSQRIDRARMSYGRLVTEVPRQCVIVGTTNDDAYLRDSTGNRRFWPVKIDRFDLAALRRDVTRSGPRRRRPRLPARASGSTPASTPRPENSRMRVGSRSPGLRPSATRSARSRGDCEPTTSV